ncbi:hypothetical protein KBB49_04245 [Candidatus Saccharibacteria bacterium]|nr:hypothetical protein [Candidatus Saccharibacteria bacterium]
MSDIPNPEQINWYKQLEPLEDIFGERFSLYTDGYIYMDPMRFDYDVIIDGGITKLVETIDTFSPRPTELFEIIKYRLGISKGSFVGPSKRWMNENQRLRISFQDLPSTEEAMFFIALSMATPERPVEKVLREIREWGGALLALDKVPVEVDKVEEFKAKIDEMHIPYYYSDVLAERMYASPAIRKFVESFAYMKEAFMADNRTAVGKILSELPELLAVANRAMSLGKSEEEKRDEWRQSMEEKPFNLSDYTIIMGHTVADIKHPDFVNRYPLKVVSDPRHEILPGDLGKLKLAVVPRNYEYERRRQGGADSRRAADDWF